jgi:hypothetical protein
MYADCILRTSSLAQCANAVPPVRLLTGDR